jgi:hypothetical protein
VEILSKGQRNALFDAVVESGLFADDFSYESRPGESTNIADSVIITHNATGSQFSISHHRRDFDLFSAQSRIGDDPWLPSTERAAFGNSLDKARSWSNGVAEWMKTPDLWKSVSGRRRIPGQLAPDSANIPFTAQEQKAISDQLRAISESIKKTYELTTEQSTRLDEKFEEAEKASRRMGRKDWGLLFGGAVFSLILSDVITPGIAGHILMMIEHGIGQLFVDSTTIRGVLNVGGD